MKTFEIALPYHATTSVLGNISQLVASFFLSTTSHSVSLHFLSVGLGPESQKVIWTWVKDRARCFHVGKRSWPCASGGNANVVRCIWLVRPNNCLSRSTPALSFGWVVGSKSILLSLGGREMGRWGGRPGQYTGLQMHWRSFRLWFAPSSATSFLFFTSIWLTSTISYKVECLTFDFSAEQLRFGFSCRREYA